MVHRNAPLSETGRLRLARCVVEDCWPLRRAAERFQVSATTAGRWAGRYRAGRGRDGRSVLTSASQPTPYADTHGARIIKVRSCVVGDQHESATCWVCIPQRCTGCLTRYRLAKLRWLDRPTGRVVRRMEPARCGDMVHVDVKKLGKIPAGGGWRMLGRTAGNHNSRADKSSGSREELAIRCAVPLSAHGDRWPFSAGL